MKIGYIQEIDLSLNPHLTEQWQFKEASFIRRISSYGDRVYSKMLLYPVDYEEIVSNANMMKDNPSLILVHEPFLLDDELRRKAIKWVEWANKEDRSKYDPCAHYFKCSNCKYTVPHRKANLFNRKREYNYCPHCGAKMDG